MKVMKIIKYICLAILAALFQLTLDYILPIDMARANVILIAGFVGMAWSGVYDTVMERNKS